MGYDGSKYERRCPFGINSSLRDVGRRKDETRSSVRRTANPLPDGTILASTNTCTTARSPPAGPSPTKRKQLISNMAPSACSTAEKVRGGSTNVGQKGRKRGAYCHQSGASAARTSAGFGGSEEGSDDEVEGDIFGRTTRRPRSKPQSSALSFGRQVLEEHVVSIGALKRFVWRH